VDDIQRKGENVSSQPFGTRVVDGNRKSEDIPSRREEVSKPVLPPKPAESTTIDGDRSNKTRQGDLAANRNGMKQSNSTLGEDMSVSSNRLSTRGKVSGTGNEDGLQEVASKVYKEKETAYPAISERRQRIQEAWTRLRNKRTEAQTLRVHVGELWAGLEIHKKDLKKADDLFMDQARAFINKNSASENQELELSFRQLIEARTEFNIEENELERVRGKLILTEGELREIESSMYQVPVTPSAGSLEDDFDVVARERDPTESIVSSGNIRGDSSPQAQRYLSQLGQRDLLKERLMDLDSHHAQVVEEQAVREDIGLVLDDYSRLFLDRYEREREELSLELEAAEKLLEDYKADLEDRDHHISGLNSSLELSSAADGYSTAHSLYGKDDSFDDALAGESNPEDPRHAAIAETYLFPANCEAVDKTEYINSWLLDRLRNSTKEITLLRKKHAGQGIFLNATDFRRQVLFYWDRDETVQPRFTNTSRDASMAIHSGETPVSRPRTEGHIRVESNANANVLHRTRSAQPPQAER
jgi:hypothetical protein